jgi:hypothetical protein
LLVVVRAYVEAEPLPEEDDEEPGDQERGIPGDYPSEGKFH